MEQDRIIGTARNVGGKVQEALGRSKGDDGMQAGGAANQLAGTAEDLYGLASDGISDLARGDPACWRARHY